RTRNNAKVSVAGTNCTLSRDKDILAVMILPRNVVVMTVYFDVGGNSIRLTVYSATQILKYTPHHLLAVLIRVFLAPLEIIKIVLKLLSSLGEIRKIRIWKLDEHLLHDAFSLVDVTLSYDLTDVARARV